MTTDLLQTWLKQHLPDIPVQIVDTGQPAGDCICMALCDVGAVERFLPNRADGSRPLRVRMTYRLTAPFARPEDGHRVLCEIMFAALENPIAYGPDGALIPVEVLASATARDRFGPQPGAGLYLEIVAERAAGARDAPPVLEPAVINAGQSRTPSRPGS